MSEAALVVLMRWPSPGRGKTRLGAGIGVEAAHRLHTAMVADTLGWPAPRPRLLAVDGPPRAVRAAGRRAPDAVVVVQSDGSLGRRLARALGAAIGHGAERAVLVGTDSPTLPQALLGECLSLARPGVAAMVPAADGGFVALAVHRHEVDDSGIPWLEGAIPWSTSGTAQHLRREASARGVTLRSTAPWYDIDTAADLHRLHRDVIESPGRAPHTRRCLAGWLPAEPGSPPAEPVPSR